MTRVPLSNKNLPRVPAYVIASDTAFVLTSKSAVNIFVRPRWLCFIFWVWSKQQSSILKPTTLFQIQPIGYCHVRNISLGRKTGVVNGESKYLSVGLVVEDRQVVQRWIWIHVSFKRAHVGKTTSCFFFFPLWSDLWVLDIVDYVSADMKLKLKKKTKREVSMF